MSSLTTVREAMADTVNTIDGITAYAKTPSRAVVPCCVILPMEADFTRAFGRGLDTWDFHLIIGVTRTEFSVAEDKLDGFINGFGEQSIREVLFKNPNMGLDDTAVVAVKMLNYLHNTHWGGVEILSATLQVTVHTKGFA